MSLNDHIYDFKSRFESETSKHYCLILSDKSLRVKCDILIDGDEWVVEYKVYYTDSNNYWNNRLLYSFAEIQQMIPHIILVDIEEYFHKMLLLELIDGYGKQED